MIIELDHGQATNDHVMLYRELHACHSLPMARMGGRDYYAVAGYADAALVLAEPTTRMCPADAAGRAQACGHATSLLWDNALSMMDPPQHTRLRRVAARAFTSRQAEQLRPTIRKCVEDVLERVPIGEPVEVSGGFAAAIPMKVICMLLGIPERDWPELQAWTESFLPVFLPGNRNAAERAEIEAASTRFVDFFSRLLSSRRRHPGADLVSTLLAAEVDGQRLKEEALIGILRGLLTAGFETTASTITAGMLSLEAEHRADLRANPDLIPNAVEELLRWETPVRLQARNITQPLALSHGELAKGSAVIVMLGAANHDPATFNEPDRLDIWRTGPAHLSFGAGRHFCLGAYLARVELQETLRFIVSKWIDWQVCTSPPAVRRSSPQFPALTSLHISIGRRERPTTSAQR
jgi:cytochrome P450